MDWVAVLLIVVLVVAVIALVSYIAWNYYKVSEHDYAPPTEQYTELDGLM